MSKKTKPTCASTSYFSEARNYDKAVEAETSFFNGLASMRAEFAGNITVDKSIREMATFVKDPKGRSIAFTVEFPVVDPRKNAPYLLFLGTRLSPMKAASMAEFTHYLCLADDKSLLAKYHADLDCDPHAGEKKPSPHAQIGGRIPEELKTRYSNQYWHLDVNKPRIPALPICTALLWHWAFLEFPGCALFAKVLKNTWWNKLIRDAECAVLKPFFADGARLLQQDSGNGLLNAFYVPFNK